MLALPLSQPYEPDPHIQHLALLIPDLSFSRLLFRFRINVILILETALHFVIGEEYCKIFINLY